MITLCGVFIILGKVKTNAKISIKKVRWIVRIYRSLDDKINVKPTMSVGRKILKTKNCKIKPCIIFFIKVLLKFWSGLEFVFLIFHGLQL